MDISPLQIKWLNRHGGRTPHDVELDERGAMFISLYHPQGVDSIERVYLPDDERLTALERYKSAALQEKRAAKVRSSHDKEQRDDEGDE